MGPQKLAQMAMKLLPLPQLICSTGRTTHPQEVGHKASGQLTTATSQSCALWWLKGRDATQAASYFSVVVNTMTKAT